MYFSFSVKPAAIKITAKIAKTYGGAEDFSVNVRLIKLNSSKPPRINEDFLWLVADSFIMTSNAELRGRHKRRVKCEACAD